MKPCDIEYLGRFIDSLTDEEIIEINGGGERYDAQAA